VPHGFPESGENSPQLAFPDREQFRQWLCENHGASSGVWLVFSKSTRIRTLRPGEALEEALCFGWIDGQIRSLDDEKYLKMFTPRRAVSRWSAANRAIGGRLIESGRMTDHGMAAIERARSKGTWETPRRAPASDDQIEALEEALVGADLALANFRKMPPSSRRIYASFYLDAKSDGARARRLSRIIQRLNANKKDLMSRLEP
jgi:uncharacterized protein YdeI (YjbR/CyaY-like superfamily)